LGQVIRGPRMLMITATTITATTITVMRPRQFVITVTMRIPRSHAPPMDTGDQISLLTVYSSAPARGFPVGMDKDITAAVVMADMAAAVAVTAAVAGDTAVAVILREDVADTAVAVILQEDVADTAAAVKVTTAVAGDTAVAVILQEDVADTPAEMVGMLAVDIVGTVAVSTALASARTAAVVVTAVMVTAVMVTAVADTKSAISSRLGEKGWPRVRPTSIQQFVTLQ
jgi:hypothetical protein